MDYNVCTLAQSQLLVVPHSAMLSLFQQQTRIAHLFWRETLTYGSLFREWMVGIGRRPAYTRIAHLFCELFTRMQAIRTSGAQEIDLPLTQTDIGDALGLSTVHVNRTLQELRAAGLIKFTRGKLTPIDWAGLCEAGEFDESYLHQQLHDRAGSFEGR